MLEKACKWIIQEILTSRADKEELRKIKRRAAIKFKLDKVPRNSKIMEFCTENERELLKPILMRKPTRSISGISVVAVMARPYPCPHGSCIYCPQGPEAPQSYTGREPATMRAIMNKFSAWKQVNNRLTQLKAIGHPVDKIELIVMGGTFPAQPRNYQRTFIKGCYDSLTGKKTKSFPESKKLAEKSKSRPIGLTIETRPDFCKENEIKNMLNLGLTRVELGVQTIYPEILEKIGRKHSLEDTIESTQLLKDAGVKICYHLMPGLPGSTPKKDLEVFKTVFKDPRFKPDMLKIYPTLVIKGTELYKMWKSGKYKEMNSEQATKLIAKAKKYIPNYVRVMRITRDIPANLIAAGVKKSDLRELVRDELKKHGLKCSCIRCREVGHVFRRENILPEKIEIKEQKYKASKGTEYFISVEDFKQGILIGYLRLRFTSEGKAIVRELHVYGPEVLIGSKAKATEFQHRGFGKKLLHRAEEICKENGKSELLILSGIGAKPYYRKLGYKDHGFYLAKKIAKL